MQKITLVFILFAIIALSIASYFLIDKFSKPQNAYLYPTPTLVQITAKLTAKPTVSQTSQCLAKDVTAIASAQGAAGNIYVNLELTNTGKTACDVELGNQVIATFDGKYIVPQNITIHNMQQATTVSYMLPPGAKLYSQVHYPNGPQCQSGIKPIAISFLLGQSTVSFEPDSQSGKLMVQACKSDSEKTTIDFWPLSKNPVTP